MPSVLSLWTLPMETKMPEETPYEIKTTLRMHPTTAAFLIVFGDSDVSKTIMPGGVAKIERDKDHPLGVIKVLREGEEPFVFCFGENPKYERLLLNLDVMEALAHYGRHLHYTATQFDKEPVKDG